MEVLTRHNLHRPSREKTSVELFMYYPVFNKIMNICGEKSVESP